MQTRKSFISFLTVILLLFGSFFLIGSSSSAAALKDIPQLTFKNGKISFFVPDGCDGYIFGYADGGSLFGSANAGTTETIDVNETLARDGRKSGTYTLSLQLYGDNVDDYKTWSTTYQYKSLGIDLSAPVNLKFNASTKTLSWNAGTNHSDTQTYQVLVWREDGDGQSHSAFYTTTDTSLYACFLEPGSHNYCAQIKTYDSGTYNTTSEYSGTIKFSYDLQIPKLQGLKVGTDGFLTWKAVDSQARYHIYVSSKSSKGYMIEDVKEAKFNLEEAMRDKGMIGEKVEITVFAFAPEGYNKVLLSEESTITYASKTVAYPLNYNGKPVTSRDNLNDLLNDGGSVKYDPTNHTLTFDHLNKEFISIPGAVFYSDEDITVRGSLNVSFTFGSFIESKGNVRFGQGSNIVFNAGFDPAVKAKNVAINSSLFMIDSTYDTMEISGNIAFGTTCGYAIFDSFESTNGALYSTGGKIVLNDMKVQAPLSGLNPDQKSIPNDHILLVNKAITIDGVVINEKNFPDENFRAYVRDKIDTDNNLILSQNERSVFRIECDKSLNVGSVQGIEFFPFVNYLSIESKTMTQINIKSNLELNVLIIAAPIKELDISSHPRLYNVYELGETENNYFDRVYPNSDVYMKWDISEDVLLVPAGTKIFTGKPTPTPWPSSTYEPTPTETATPTSVPGQPTSAVANPTSGAKPTSGAARPTSTSANPTSATAKPTSSASQPAVTGDPKSQILAFVERIYIYVLDREPEAEGAAFWSDELYAFRRTGAEVAQGFIFSDEFNARNTSDKEFVTILYKTFFGRDPEDEGMNFWLSQLSNGTMDRVTVANGFIYSQEWADTCASYGIRSGGDLKPSGRIEPTSLTYAFVERMYTTAMGRGYDEEGRQYWASELANFNITGEHVGAAFFLSDEMNGYGLSDKDFLGRLYATFMNREPDAEGEAYWLSQMSSGVPRADIVFGFTRSPEFTDKCIEARILPY